MPVPGDGSTSTFDVQRALEGLLFYQRSALVMREVGHLSYAQIAQTLRFSLDAVEPLVFAARHTLLAQLDGAPRCREAELALSRQLDDRLSSAEAAFLQVHLRDCAECATLARRQRGYRAAMNALGAIQLPLSLATWGSRDSAGTARALPLVGGRLAAKAAAVVRAGLVIGGAYEASKRLGNSPAAEHAASGGDGLLAGEAPNVRATVSRCGSGRESDPRRASRHVDAQGSRGGGEAAGAHGEREPRLGAHDDPPPTTRPRRPAPQRPARE